jgi:hypothetical protein
MSLEQSIDAAAGQSSPADVREDIHKFTVPISGNRKLYFYTFGDEQLELPEGAVITEVSEAVNV